MWKFELLKQTDWYSAAHTMRAFVVIRTCKGFAASLSLLATTRYIKAFCFTPN